LARRRDSEEGQQGKIAKKDRLRKIKITKREAADRKKQPIAVGDTEPGA
jgi:hypothetical protein